MPGKKEAEMISHRCISVREKISGCFFLNKSDMSKMKPRSQNRPGKDSSPVDSLRNCEQVHRFVTIYFLEVLQLFLLIKTSPVAILVKGTK